MVTAWWGLAGTGDSDSVFTSSMKKHDGPHGHRSEFLALKIRKNVALVMVTARMPVSPNWQPPT